MRQWLAWWWRRLHCALGQHRWWGVSRFGAPPEYYRCWICNGRKEAGA
jgi:hypothetical protein